MPGTRRPKGLGHGVGIPVSSKGLSAPHRGCSPPPGRGAAIVASQLRREREREREREKREREREKKIGGEAGDSKCSLS